MVKETKREILFELNSHLAAALDCLSFIRNKQVSDANSITKEEEKWATDYHDNLMKMMDEVDEKRKK